MQKLLGKKILNILDEIETQNIERSKLLAAVQQELIKDDLSYSLPLLEAFIAYLYQYGLLKETRYGMDLAPAATIFARAKTYSRLEALAVFECFYRNQKLRNAWKLAIQQKSTIDSLLPDGDIFTLPLIDQTSLVFHNSDRIRITDRYVQDVKQIMDEVDEGETPLLSVKLCSLYACAVVDHQNLDITYKNQDHSLVPYHHLSTILTEIPRRGIPCERNATKVLQSFYKDTLFHEFDHHCPLCGIALPHMLIASHVKPFRECAHIYEAIDHQNGLLLCRNHDYLFDQGYISFSDEGALMISKELSDQCDLKPYQLPAAFKLPQQYLTVTRRLFLAYHRRHIFKG